MITKRMDPKDLDSAATIHSEAFPRQRLSHDWLSCSLKAFPRTLCFIIEEKQQILGYIIWSQKSGFRPEVVLELEQIAVLPNHQGHGVGAQLIRESLALVKEQLSSVGSKLKHIVVSTRSDNHAQRLYRNALGAEIEATISDLYSADEVYMIARDIGNRI